MNKEEKIERLADKLVFGAGFFTKEDFKAYLKHFADDITSQYKADLTDSLEERAENFLKSQGEYSPSIRKYVKQHLIDFAQSLQSTNTSEVERLKEDNIELRKEVEELKKKTWYNEWNKILDETIRPLPKCRDCADSNGFCCYDNQPCDPTDRVIHRFKTLEKNLMGAYVKIAQTEEQLESQLSSEKEKAVKFEKELKDLKERVHTHAQQYIYYGGNWKIEKIIELTTVNK